MTATAKSSRAPKVTPRARAHDGNTQHVALGRSYMAKARAYANANNYTIRSVIECSIDDYLKGGNGAPAEAINPVKTMIEVTRDGGETWKPGKIRSQMDSKNTTYVHAEDGMTYERESDKTVNPYRWRWPKAS